VTRIRFRLRTIMIAIVLVAALMGVVRYVLFLYSALGIDPLLFLALNATLYVYIPILVIVELLFFVSYFWLRRKRAGQVLTSGRIATPESRLSGDAEEERLCKRGPGR
jgi:hypothetical protein